MTAVSNPQTDSPLADLEKSTSVKARGGVVYQVIFSGIGLSSDGYNAQVISSASLVLSRLYPLQLTTDLKTRLSQAYFIGVIVGALMFGCMIDRISRRAGVLLVTVLLLIGVAMSTCASGVSVRGMVWMLIVSRGVLGVGAGGEYPVCTTGATEASNETAAIRKWRGVLIALVGDFAIDVGIVMGGVMPLIVLVAYGYRAGTSPEVTTGLQVAWRIFLGLGGLVPSSVFYFRYRLVTSSSFQRHNIQRQGGLSIRLYWFVAKRYWKSLIGACLCWFIYDFVAYPASLLAAPAIDGLSSGGQKSLVQSIGYGALINLFTLPGSLIGAFLLDRIGRKNTQMAGFVVQAVFGFILAGALAPIKAILPLFIILYGLFIASAEAGPGVATILISAEVAPTAVRGHFVGLAAAVGKAGAAIGTQVFSAIQGQFADEVRGQQAVFYAASGFSIMGALLTYSMIPTMSTDLEVEDRAFEQWLASNASPGPVFVPATAHGAAHEAAATLSYSEDAKRQGGSTDDEEKVSKGTSAVETDSDRLKQQGDDDEMNSSAGEERKDNQSPCRIE